jgi:hypothetical protein
MASNGDKASDGEKPALSAFNRLKKHGKTGYSGMKIGTGHKWYYDQGEWREHKMTPDEWSISYQTTKRRAGKAPKGSGAPVGTEYNWLIVAHQRVDKLDANNYSTCLEGMKFKVAHKRAVKDKWNASEDVQRKKVITYLQQVIDELKQEDEDEVSVFTVGEHDRIYGLEHENKSELVKLAAKLNVSGRSKMGREELIGAIKDGFRQAKIAREARRLQSARDRQATKASRQRSQAEHQPSA